MQICGVLFSLNHWRMTFFPGLSHQSSKFPNSSFGRGVYSSRLDGKGAMNADGDSRLKRGLFFFYPWHLGYIVPRVMLIASCTLTLKDRRNLHLQHWVHMKDITLRTLWLRLCEIADSICLFVMLLFVFRISKETRAVLEESTRKGSVHWKTDIFNLGGTSKRYGRQKWRSLTRAFVLLSVLHLRSVWLFWRISPRVVTSACTVLIGSFWESASCLYLICLLIGALSAFSRAFQRLRLLSVLIGFLVQFCFLALFAECLQFVFLFQWVLSAASAFPLSLSLSFFFFFLPSVIYNMSFILLV